VQDKTSQNIASPASAWHNYVWIYSVINQWLTSEQSNRDGLMICDTYYCGLSPGRLIGVGIS